jgi:hypothetical protein
MALTPVLLKLLLLLVDASQCAHVLAAVSLWQGAGMVGLSGATARTCRNSSRKGGSIDQGLV